MGNAFCMQNIFAQFNMPEQICIIDEGALHFKQHKNDRDKCQPKNDACDSFLCASTHFSISLLRILRVLRIYYTTLYHFLQLKRRREKSFSQRLFVGVQIAQYL